MMSIVFVVLGKHFDCVSSVSGGNLSNDGDDAVGGNIYIKKNFNMFKRLFASPSLG